MPFVLPKVSKLFREATDCLQEIKETRARSSLLCSDARALNGYFCREGEDIVT